MGSRSLTRALEEADAAAALREEKRLGDLAIKIYEHFLPLFVGTYSAAPYRIGFTQFHPERLLSFLPHELDFTHLRLHVARVEGKSQAEDSRPAGDALWAALARPRHARASSVCAEIGSRLPAADLSRGMAVDRARVGAGRRAGKHAAPGVGVGSSSASSTGACRSTCRCDCASSARAAIRASKRATTACFPAMTATWRRRPICSNFFWPLRTHGAGGSRDPRRYSRRSHVGERTPPAILLPRRRTAGVLRAQALRGTSCCAVSCVTRRRPVRAGATRTICEFPSATTAMRCWRFWKKPPPASSRTFRRTCCWAICGGDWRINACARPNG